jgi:uncharacterized protein YjlB
VPVGTAFHERTLALCESLSYREWSGYYTVSVYETHHEHEYNAIRNSAALIDISGDCAGHQQGCGGSGDLLLLVRPHGESDR